MDFGFPIAVFSFFPADRRNYDCRTPGKIASRPVLPGVAIVFPLVSRPFRPAGRPRQRPGAARPAAGTAATAGHRTVVRDAARRRHGLQSDH